MSFQATQWAWTVKLTPRALPDADSMKGVGICAQRLILLLLADQSNHHGGVFSSHRYLSHTTGLSRRTVQRGLSALVQAGLVEIAAGRRLNGRHTTNTYTLQLNAGESTKAPSAAPVDCTVGTEGARSVHKSVDNVPTVGTEGAGGGVLRAHTGGVLRAHPESISINLDHTGRSDRIAEAVDNVAATHNNVAPPQMHSKPDNQSDGGDVSPNAPNGAPDKKAPASGQLLTAPDGANGSAVDDGEAPIGAEYAERVIASLAAEFSKRWRGGGGRLLDREKGEAWRSLIAQLNYRQIRFARARVLDPQCLAPPSAGYFASLAREAPVPAASARNPGRMPFNYAEDVPRHAPTKLGADYVAQIRGKFNLKTPAGGAA